MTAQLHMRLHMLHIINMQFTLLNAFIDAYADYTYVYLYTPLYPSFLSANANVEITSLYNHIYIERERGREVCVHGPLDNLASGRGKQCQAS